MATTPDEKQESNSGYQKVLRTAEAAVKGVSERSLLVAAAAGLAVGLERPAEAASLSILIYVITKR